jgi:hypothetical protein
LREFQAKGGFRRLAHGLFDAFDRGGGRVAADRLAEHQPEHDL